MNNPGRITEQEAAELFFANTFHTIEQSWPEIYKTLQGHFKDDFVINEIDAARMELALAVLALECQSLENIYPQRATRIKQYMLNTIGSIDERTYISEKIEKYGQKTKESLAQYGRNPHYSPLEEVAAELMRNWFGENVKKFYVRDREIVDPILCAVLGHLLTLCLTAGAGFWKTVFQEGK